MAKNILGKNYLGIMSGTSLDGIDVVIVNFDKTLPKLLCSHSHPIPIQLKQTLLEIIKPTWKGSLSDIGTLNQKLGEIFSEATNTLLNKSNTDRNTIQAIGSHGQTLWHQPQGPYPFSIQLGDANLIAERTGITTIADFRSRDIAAGGQGAPLVPAFHKELLSHFDKNRIILNIGGIANITRLPSISSGGIADGFDTGPGNGMIDAWISTHKNQGYDKDGKWARSGRILNNVLNTLLKDEYFSLTPPKSTGKEAFNLLWLRKTLGSLLDTEKPENIQATLTELTAKSISDDILNGDNLDYDELFICGGGLHNKFLMERLEYYLPNIDIESTEVLGIDPDWMEAIAFAWLAKQTVEGNTANLPSVTGARGKRILGAIYPA